MCNLYTCVKGQNSRPYPNNWKKITDVNYCDPLILVRCNAGKRNRSAEEFIVGRAYKVKVKVKWKDKKESDPHFITVPCGMVTDLISIPNFLRKLFGVSKLGKHLEACVLHDFLYGAQKTHGKKNPNQDRKFADDLMNLMMMKAGVNRVKRVIIHKGIRWFASSYFNDAENEFEGSICFCKGPHKICP